MRTAKRKFASFPTSRFWNPVHSFPTTEMPPPQTFLFPSIASVLAQHVNFKKPVDSKKNFASKDHASDTSSGLLPNWTSEWYRNNCLQFSCPLPNLFEQDFTEAFNTKDINPSLSIAKHAEEEQEAATIETAQVAQAGGV